MWRHEDIFFAALGGGGFGQPAISTPEEIADGSSPEDGRVTSLMLAPIMHGAAQWGMCITLFGGGTVVLYTAARLRPARGVGARRAGAGHDASWSWATRWPGRWPRRSTQTVVRPVVGGRRRLGRCGVLARGQGQAQGAPAERAHRSTPFGASELGASGSQTGPGRRAPASNTNESMSVLGDDLRSGRAGSR